MDKIEAKLKLLKKDMVVFCKHNPKELDATLNVFIPEKGITEKELKQLIGGSNIYVEIQSESLYEIFDVFAIGEEKEIENVWFEGITQLSTPNRKVNYHHMIFYYTHK